MSQNDYGTRLVVSPAASGASAVAGRDGGALCRCPTRTGAVPRQRPAAQRPHPVRSPRAERNQKKERDTIRRRSWRCVDALLENFIGHPASQLAKQHSIPDKLDRRRSHRQPLRDDQAASHPLRRRQLARHRR